MSNAELAGNIFGIVLLVTTAIGITWMVVSAIREELKRKRPN